MSEFGSSLNAGLLQGLPDEVGTFGKHAVDDSQRLWQVVTGLQDQNAALQAQLNNLRLGDISNVKIDPATKGQYLQLNGSSQWEGADVATSSLTVQGAGTISLSLTASGTDDDDLTLDQSKKYLLKVFGLNRIYSAGAIAYPRSWQQRAVADVVLHYDTEWKMSGLIDEEYRRYSIVEMTDSTSTVDCDILSGLSGSYPLTSSFNNASIASGVSVDFADLIVIDNINLATNTSYIDLNITGTGTNLNIEMDVSASLGTSGTTLRTRVTASLIEMST